MSNRASNHPHRFTRRSAVGFALAGACARAFAATPRVQFVFGTYGMKSLPAREAIETTANTGYDGVELCVMQGYSTDAATMTGPQLRELRDFLKQRQLSVPSVLDSLSIVGSPQSKDARLERIRRIAEVAHAVSTDTRPILDTVLGGKQSDWPACRAAMVDELRAWAEVCERSALTVAIKAHADQAIDRPDRAVDLLRQVDSARIRLVYDYSHFHVAGLSLEKSLTTLFPYTVLISLKDSSGTSSAHQYLLPGDGDTDYPSYFRLLAKLGYRGAIGIEVSSMLHRRPDYDPVRTAKLCYQRLAPLFAPAGLVRPIR